MRPLARSTPTASPSSTNDSTLGAAAAAAAATSEWNLGVLSSALRLKARATDPARE